MKWIHIKTKTSVENDHMSKRIVSFLCIHHLWLKVRFVSISAKCVCLRHLKSFQRNKVEPITKCKRGIKFPSISLTSMVFVKGGTKEH